jgi:uncharacterized protein YbbK (DUF523 family)
VRLFIEILKRLLRDNASLKEKGGEKIFRVEIKKPESEGKRVALSACLYGVKCRYDASNNKDVKLLNRLQSQGYEIVLFCPEEASFGTPRPTIDLIETERGIKAISNLTGADLTPYIEEYALNFFKKNSNIELFIGKDRSPSCGVKSAKIYDREKSLLRADGSGVMANIAKRHSKEVWDAEQYLQIHKKSRMDRDERDQKDVG